MLLDLLMNWRLTPNPKTELFKLLATVLVSFLIGLLPGIDNFSHIGGFIMGICTGLLLMPRQHFSKWDRFTKQALKIASVPLILLLFIGLLIAFYNSSASQVCSWCKYLNCVPIAGLCDVSTLPQ